MCNVQFTTDAGLLQLHLLQVLLVLEVTIDDVSQGRESNNHHQQDTQTRLAQGAVDFVLVAHHSHLPFRCVLEVVEEDVCIFTVVALEREGTRLARKAPRFLNSVVVDDVDKLFHVRPFGRVFLRTGYQHAVLRQQYIERRWIDVAMAQGVAEPVQ